MNVSYDGLLFSDKVKDMSEFGKRTTPWLARIGDEEREHDFQHDLHSQSCHSRGQCCVVVAVIAC
jgi:hypothetical protein